MNFSVHRITELIVGWNCIPSSDIPILTITAKTNDPARVDITLFCLSSDVVSQFIQAAKELDIPLPRA